MASDRDTLAEAASSYRDALACMLTTGPFDSPRYREFAAADRVLAAGWRPPAQVITTAAELDALPRWSIVVIDNVAVQRTDNDWRAMNAPSLRIASTALLQLRGALTLVYVPTEEVESRG